MEATVTDGTATRVFKGMAFAVAGKTGTAHVSDGPIKYAHGVYQATFAGYFPADKPQFTCIIVIRTKPHAASHYGGTVAAPVFREIATKLYAMYVEKKTPSQFFTAKDSSAFFYAGNAVDIKKVFQSMSMPFADSAKTATWATVYANNYSPVVRTATVRQQVMPNVKGMGLKDAVFLLENLGVKVLVKGKGKVVVQSVEAGRPLGKGTAVLIELS
jgi:cell division protein FtsI (penicillin-binding protein 3)